MMKQFTNPLILQMPNQDELHFLDIRPCVLHEGPFIIKWVTMRARKTVRFKALQKGEWFIVLPFVILAFVKLTALAASLLLPH